MSTEMTIIEVNGVKIEVDLRTARRIETIKVGSPVKLLSKGGYSSSQTVYPGVVIGFEPFKDLPTIIVAYVEADWSTAKIKIAHINSKQEAFDLIAAVDKDFSVDKISILSQFNRQIDQKRKEIEAIEEQKRYFETNFATFWTRVQAEEGV